jgi:hypothetical protein
MIGLAVHLNGEKANCRRHGGPQRTKCDSETDRPIEYKSAKSAAGNMQKINEKKRKLRDAQKARSSAPKTAHRKS